MAVYARKQPGVTIGNIMATGRRYRISAAIITVHPYPQDIQSEIFEIHFAEFNGSYYVANAKKQMAYSDDETFNREEYLYYWKE